MTRASVRQHTARGHETARLVSLSVGLALAAFGCGGPVDETDTSDREADTPDEPSWLASRVVTPTVAVTAPTRTLVSVALLGPPRSGVPDAIGAFHIASDEVGELEVKSAYYDPISAVVSLETAPQKLGATYTLAVDAPGSALAGVVSTFVAADTARFWASDFATQSDYEVDAVRVGVGRHAVLYAQKKFFPDDVAETIAAFDEKIFPIETSLFGAAPDRDENGKIILLALDGAFHYAGYFNAVDTLTDEEAKATYGLRSNEGEILYLNVSILGGFDPKVTIPHEFLHLLHQEEHGMDLPYFGYHDEGLAECAVHAVNGHHPEAAAYYASDPTGELANGLSLVHWEHGNYSQYVQAYLFWTYAAAQLGGVERYGDLFRTHGSPEDIDAFFQDEMGVGFADVQRRALMASWVQAKSGPYGFNGFLSFPGSPHTVPAGLSSVPLAPFSAVFFHLGVEQVDGLAPHGDNVTYAGIDAHGNVDVVPPYDVAGGVLVAYNGRFDWTDPTPEDSGPGLPAMAFAGPPPVQGEVVLGAAPALEPKRAGVGLSPVHDRDPAWRHPPPLRPWDPAAFQAWRARTSLPLEEALLDLSDAQP